MLLEGDTDVKRKYRQALPRPTYFMLSQPIPSVGSLMYLHMLVGKSIFFPNMAQLHQVEALPDHKPLPNITGHSMALPVGRVANVLVLF